MIDKPMTKEEARGIAATAWCQPETEGKTMDPELAESFADILIEQSTRE